MHMSSIKTSCTQCKNIPEAFIFFFFLAEDGIRVRTVTGVQTCALPIFRVLRSDFAHGLSPKRKLGPARYSRNPGFTETLLRPLARRREMTARPLLVFIRVRNPCVFERRRRLGWNVRFGMKNPALLVSATKCEAVMGEQRV